MKYLRNIKPHEVIKITDMINHSGKSIASKALIDNYEMETLFVMLEGSAKIVYNKDDEKVINPGDIIAMESDIEYGVEALTDMKLFNILVKVD